MLQVPVQMAFIPGRAQVFHTFTRQVICSNISPARPTRVGSITGNTVEFLSRIAIRGPIGGQLPEIVIEGAVLLHHYDDMIDIANGGIERNGRSAGAEFKALAGANQHRQANGRCRGARSFDPKDHPGPSTSFQELTQPLLDERKPLNVGLACAYSISDSLPNTSWGTS